MLGVSHERAVKVLCEAQTDIVMVVVRQRPDLTSVDTVNISLYLDVSSLDHRPLVSRRTAQTVIFASQQL